MSNPIKKSVAAVAATVMMSTVFLSGYYLGASTTGFAGTPAEAASSADLTAFWKVWRILDDKYVSTGSDEEVDQDERIKGAIKGMVSALNDPYTVFLDEKELESFESDISGSFEGVGMEVGEREGVLTVIAPIKGTPAEAAGMKTGDQIIKIDDTSTYEMTVDEAVGMIRGKAGTPVVFTVIREGSNDPISISVTRAKIELPTIETELRDDGIFVIRVYTFSANSASLFRKALREFVSSQSQKLVLDLRGNPGGYLESAIDMASWFLPAGKVVVREDFGEGKAVEELRSKGYNIFGEGLDMVVLIDKGSASASEILAGALQSHDVATLVGEQSFGKGSVQELVEVTSNTSLKVTIARWLTPDGTSISKQGLTPDILVTKDASSTTDVQFEKAIEVVNGL